MSEHNSPPDEQPTKPSAPPLDLPDRLGPYRLVRKVGEVYEADPRSSGDREPAAG